MFDDIFELSDQEKIALKKSREIKIPFPISGYLVRASMIGPICFGMVYHHVKAGRAKKNSMMVALFILLTWLIAWSMMAVLLFLH